MKTLCSKCYIALALLLLLTPGLGMAVFGSSGAAANERLSPPPALRARDGGLNPRVLNESSDWLADHFALRRELVTLWAELNAALGSSAQEQVILGREGWLYYAPSLPDYCGLALSDQELEAIARRLPLSRVRRPEWDIRALSALGLCAEADPDIWQRVWSRQEKVNFASTPLFMVCGCKA